MAAKKDILVAEDDQFLVKIYKAKLTKEGFDVRIALDGDEAMAEIKKKIPDIMLLDLIMPKKDGFEVLEEMKKDGTLKKIPVIILSNLGQEVDVHRGLELGAKDYLVKANTSLVQVINRIKSYLK